MRMTRDISLSSALSGAFLRPGSLLGLALAGLLLRLAR